MAIVWEWEAESVQDSRCVVMGESKKEAPI